MNTYKYIFPPVELLDTPETTDNDSGGLSEELRSSADRLIKVLEEYGVSATVKDIKHGPAVTRCEITPAAGVKMNKITSLSKEIALRLAAISVRIEAPIPGRSTVGIEIPNRTRETVYLRELIDSEPFRCVESPLTVALGRDIEGNIVLVDLAKMPNLIIAGSTGTGKSVCINSILISLIYKTSPDDVRLILADPKGVELNEYKDIPHLLVPVLYDEEKGAGALLWAFLESCKRYDLLSKNNASDIDEYNELAGKTKGMEKLPRIVMVIDEMAGILDVSPVKVKEAASRLAVKGRRVGIHLIISTQRPTPDVLPEWIKCNIPSRIAFAVPSTEDSLAILDEDGAESLIGKGDMLFKPLGRNARRIQGCFVSEDEVTNITYFVKSRGTAEYDETAWQEINRLGAGLKIEPDTRGGEDETEDPLLFRAFETVLNAGQATTSLLQRRLGIGYARSGRLISLLESKGIIGPFRGSGPREVLVTAGEFAKMKMSAANEDMGLTARNWKEYREIIKNMPYTEGLNYAPVAVWLHPESIPVGVISPYDKKASIIRIPETAVNKYGKTVPVSAVGKDAFRGCAAVTDIVIPPCVSAIYQGAFSGCLSLKRITIPKAVKKIGQRTFENCAALTDIYYEGSPDEWKEIEIVHCKHEVELGELTPGSPVQEKAALRYIHIPGNEPLYSANIHFFCVF